jgi:hypothetical protein
MTFALLRVSKADWDAESFVREHGLTTAVFWRSDGSARGSGQRESGFNLPLADPIGTSRSVAEAQIRPPLVVPIGEWVRRSKKMLEAIGELRANAELHIGLSADQRESSTQATLAPVELALLARCGIRLQLWAHEPGTFRLK